LRIKSENKILIKLNYYLLSNNIIYFLNLNKLLLIKKQ